MTDIEHDPSSICPQGRLAPSHYQWGFHLSGNEGWLESFTNHFTSVDVQILPEYEDDTPTVYDFTSPHLNGLTGAQAAMRARELVILFNGVMRVRFGADFYDFTIGEGRDLWTGEPAQEDFYRTVPVPMFPDDVEDLRYLRPQRPLDPVSIQLFLARSDRHLRMIYRSSNDGSTFATLARRRGNVIAEVSSWPPKCRLLVILEQRFKAKETIPAEVTFHELNSPHYWRAEYRYESGTEVLVWKN